MTETTVPTQLIHHLIGTVPDTKKLLTQGIVFGCIAFGLFEFTSVINPNLPRVPVTWFLIVVVSIAQIVFLSKIMTVLQVPRREDLFFTLGLSYEQRRVLALASLKSTHKTLNLFTIASMTITIILEMAVFRVFSPYDLLIPPVVLFLWLYLLSTVGTQILQRGIIPPSNSDKQPRAGSTPILFGTHFARFVIIIGLFISRLTPRSIRAIVLRDTFFLFRSESLLLPLMFLAAPVLLVVMILVVGDTRSPFIDLFSAICFFAVSNWYASLLREPSYHALGNPVFSFERKQVLKAFVSTVLIFAFPIILVYMVTIAGTLITPVGIVRFLTTVSVMIVSTCIAGVVVFDPLRKDNDQATGWAFFVGSCIGLFIPWFGFIFPVLVFTAFMLKEWRCIMSGHRDEMDHGVRQDDPG